MLHQEMRSTTPSRAVAGVRVFLGILFLMTGMMKLFVPILADAFIGQLAAANIPLQELNRWLVPLVEVGVGATLLRGFQAQLSAAIVLVLMAVATYVHLIVEDAALFPLHPTAPIMPIGVIVLALFLLIRSGGTGKP